MLSKHNHVKVCCVSDFSDQAHEVVGCDFFNYVGQRVRNYLVSRFGLAVSSATGHFVHSPLIKYAFDFQVRAKHMTLDPGANRYVKHIQQIRVIQDYLVTRADRHCIPKVNNTNVDRSVALIHATILSSLRRQNKVRTTLLPRSSTLNGSYQIPKSVSNFILENY